MRSHFLAKKSGPGALPPWFGSLDCAPPRPPRHILRPLARCAIMEILSAARQLAA